MPKEKLMKYPVINHINDLLPYVEHKKNIKITKHDNGTTSFNYKTIFSPKLFNCMYARECRGITFNTKTGKILIRPFHKFFNIGERTETFPQNLDWNNIENITEKIDGSICTTMCLPNGKIIAKSKSSFDSTHANKMNRILEDNKELQEYCWDAFHNGYTPIFEYVSPSTQIVIPYKKETLILLALRNMITGEYRTFDWIKKSKKHNIPHVKKLNFNFNFTTLKEHLTELKESEGYVIKFKNGQMVKAKSLWYIRLHKCRAGLTEKNIAECCLNGDIDDIRGMMTIMELDQTRVNEIDILVRRGLENLQNQTKKLFNIYDYEYDPNRRRGRASKKKFALEYKNEKVFTLATRLMSDKPVDYIAFYKKHILPTKFFNLKLFDN